MIRSTLLAGAALALFPCTAFAQPADPAEDAQGASQPATPPAQPRAAPGRGSHSGAHAADEGEIVVTGFRRNRDDILAGTSVLGGEDLDRDLRPTIGETLAHLPGVSATSFGPNSSRPVLRGFQGDRVRILTDGIGSLDASSTSVDHAVAINPLTADRIEVLRGPSALLFGSSAIGGVVNVIDSRIPRRVPDEAVHFEGILTYGSAADERSANAAVDVPIGEHLVFHVDGNYSKSDDLEVGGFVLSRALRDQAAASPDPGIRELAGLRGRIPNTDGRTWDVAAGLAWIDGENNAGLSINRYDSFYGVPIRYSLDPAVEAEGPHIDVAQTRADARAEIDAGSGFIDTIRFRAGYSDYRHDEVEETGDIATTFFNTGWEGRLEFQQTVRGGWGGGFGAQYFHRDLSAEGEEKFLPRNVTSQLGLFAVQTFDLGQFRAEAGARYEHSALNADADADLGNPEMRRSFDAFAGSLGGSVEIAPRIRVGLNGTYSERAPSGEELFANGPHAGTQAFEIGDPDLSKESSWGLEATLRGSGDGFSFGASVFHSWFGDYIFETPTGAIQDDLPVFQYRQADARYFGIELESSVRLGRIGGVTLNVDAVADYVRATIDDAGPAPRIPPFRLLGGLEAQSALVDGRIEAEFVSGQDRIAAFETPTGGYTMVNASLAFHPFGEDNPSTITLSANNIFDVTARRHASLLKDHASLAGRDLRITARLAF